jgi:oligopeptide transport system substrate-binding protein
LNKAFHRFLYALSITLFWAPFSFATQIINIGNAAEPKDLDPATEVGVPESRIIYNLFEALVGKDPKTLKPIPAIAESWKISDDGKVYTFKLRKDVKWSNGDPLTAEDYVFSWRRLLSPSLASVYAYYGFYLKNGKRYNAGEIKDPSEVGVKALDKFTLQATLENPAPFFLDLLFHQSMYAVPRKVVEKYGNRWTRPENIVSNGAYILDKWELNKAVTLKKNPVFWDKDKVSIDQANFLPVGNSTTEESMFRRGEIDVTSIVPTEKITLWQKDKSGVYNQNIFLGTFAFKCNITKAPLNNKWVRKALALTIDRQKITKFVLRSGQRPATSYTPSGTAGYVPDAILPATTRPEDIAEAKSLLAKAGYADIKKMPHLEILYNTDDGLKKIMEAVQEMWKRSLGISVSLYNQEWKVQQDSEHNKNYQIVRNSWIGDFNDPVTFLELFQKDSGNNNTGWSNTEYDALLEKAAKQRDEKKRFDYLRQAENILMDELPVIPVYWYSRLYLKSPKVQGWYPNIQDIHQLRFVQIKEETK